MNSITRTLCQKYTNLTDDEITHIEEMNAMLQPLANAEQADVFIDCGIPLGDAMISVNGFEQMVGSASTILNCFIMNALEGAIVEQLMLLGIDPPVFMSANLPGGDEANKRWETEYGSSARYML